MLQPAAETGKVHTQAMAQDFTSELTLTDCATSELQGVVVSAQGTLLQAALSDSQVQEPEARSMRSRNSGQLFFRPHPELRTSYQTDLSAT